MAIGDIQISDFTVADALNFCIDRNMVSTSSTLSIVDDSQLFDGMHNPVVTCSNIHKFKIAFEDRRAPVRCDADSLRETSVKINEFGRGALLPPLVFIHSKGNSQ